MKLLIASDIHLEFGASVPRLPEQDEYDVAIFAGDIGTAQKTPFWLARMEHEHCIYVPGNHEYYGIHYEGAQKWISEKCADMGIHALNPGAVTIGDYTFIGATLWPDLILQNYWNEDYEHFERGIADFRRIGMGGGPFSGKQCAELYAKELAFIVQEIEKAKAAGKTPVVITHFVPTQLAIAAQFVGDAYTPYFVNDCDQVMIDHQLPLWIFGHSHVRMDFHHPVAGTRIVSNAFGYPNEMDKPEWKIIEI